ncbi:macrosialin [Centroberyx gerrardi]|uniref:macrosialin n=1 Tax=Centroberyx gerrardi TaxID=166262 RepID=UPI003AAB6E6E
MKRALLLLCIVCSAVSALSSAEDGKRNKPAASLSPASEFSTLKPTTTTPKPTTTTPKPTTTTPKPTTTTPKPTTTTPKPTTTTPKPTTTTPKPKTTTPKPTTTTPKPTTPKPTTTTPKPTTTTPKPTTTTPKPTTPKPTTPAPPKPTPPANLTVGNYSLTDKGGICLMAQMAVQIRLVTTKLNGTFIVQPQLTKAEGKCEAPKANLTLTFKEGAITFMFNKSATEKAVYVNTLSFKLSYPFSSGGNAVYTAKNESVHLFAAKIGHSYSCKSESLYMGNGLYLDVTQDRMQAFNLTKSKEFGLPDQCVADQPDYRVAIAVGVTLLVLIVIVVVAYLLGRRRRTDGYQSL